MERKRETEKERQIVMERKTVWLFVMKSEKSEMSEM